MVGGGQFNFYMAIFKSIFCLKVKTTRPITSLKKCKMGQRPGADVSTGGRLPEFLLIPRSRQAGDTPAREPE